MKVSVDIRVAGSGDVGIGVDSGFSDGAEVPCGQQMVSAQTWQRREFIADVEPDALYIELKVKAFDDVRGWIGTIILSAP